MTPITARLFKFRRLLLAIALLLAIPSAVVGFFYLRDVAVGVSQPYVTRTQPSAAFPELGAEWPMHPVDNPGDWLANGLDIADVNDDGYADFLTNYEWSGRLRVALHPGPNLRPFALWPAIDAGHVANAESAAFGDLDGDNYRDIVVAHGVEHTHQPAGVRVFWGAPPQWPETVQGWVDGGDIPASMGLGHPVYVKTIDLDADGDVDIVIGGRASRIAGSNKGGPLTWTGIRWFENPGVSAARRLEAWPVHPIDLSTKSGHGFEFGDVDGDGDLDLVNGNADWDTPDDEEAVVWYANPGPGPAFFVEWPQYLIYQSSEFYGKEQIAITDLDGDGRIDVLTQAEQNVYWFRNTGHGDASIAIRFDFMRVPKHPAVQWRARALETADLNNDGRLDVIGALIHGDGRLPIDRAAVFWLERTDAGDWLTHAIKWGDDFLGLGAFNGEKWDQFIPYDVDDDGDLDLVANCEEYNRLRSIISVVWFENPLITRR